MKKLIIGAIALVSFSSAFAGNEIRCTYSRVNENKEIEIREYDLSKHESVIQSFGTSRLNVMKQQRGYVVAFETIGTVGPKEYGPIMMITVDDAGGAGNESLLLDLEYASFERAEQKLTCSTKYKVMFAR